MRAAAGVDALAAPVVTRPVTGMVLLLNAARVLLCVAIFGLSFLLRFNDPGGSFAGLTDDHFFYVVRGWNIAGFPEPASWYLSYCLRTAIWNGNEYPDPSDADLLAVAHDFVEHGPWATPLDKYERQFLIAQVE